MISRKQTKQVTDEEKKELGGLLLLATTNKDEIKKILLKLQTVNYIKQHFNEIKQHVEEYNISDVIDMLESVSAGQVVIDKIYPGGDEISGFNDLDIVDILKVQPNFANVKKYTVKQFCKEDTDNEETFDECIDSLEYVKTILRVPLLYRGSCGAFFVASVLIYLY